MKTARGIYVDLNESTYIYKYNKLTFYFSSQLYLNKFKKRVRKYVKDESLKIGLKYNANIIDNVMFALSLYKQIEKRGFKVKYNDIDLFKDYDIIMSIE